MPITGTVTSLINVGTSNPSGGTTRGRLDKRDKHETTLTIKLQNGATGPTTQAVVNVLIAHVTGTGFPAEGSAGADWKTVASFAVGVASNAVGEWCLTFGPSVFLVEVEVTGNTGQAVTCEAIASSCVLS